MSSLQSPNKGAIPFNGSADPRYTSAYDLFVEGNSYAEIARTLGIDIFQAMNDVATEAAIHAAQSTRAPWLDVQWANDQLRRVIQKAWDEHGELRGEKGAAYDGLPVIVQATKELVKNSKELAQIVLKNQEDEAEKLPLGTTKKDFQELGRDLIRKRFGGKLKAV